MSDMTDPTEQPESHTPVETISPNTPKALREYVELVNASSDTQSDDFTSDQEYSAAFRAICKCNLLARHDYTDEELEVVIDAMHDMFYTGVLNIGLV